jgi:hypothetical protein
VVVVVIVGEGTIIIRDLPVSEEIPSLVARVARGTYMMAGEKVKEYLIGLRGQCLRPRAGFRGRRPPPRLAAFLEKP